MRPIAILGVAGLTLAGAFCAIQVRAADLDPSYPVAPISGEPDPQFEFGTGWYLRGDASFAPDDHPVLDLNGFTRTKQDWTYALGGGIGYKFNSFLRADLTGDWFAPNDYRHTAVSDPTLVDRAKISKYDGLANLYIDLGTWYGATPYVGGGAGFAVFDPSEHLGNRSASVYDDDRTGSRTNFAWAAMAGVSYQLDANAAVDLGYRHVDLGRFSTTLTGYSIDHRYTEDQVRIGVRYMIF